MLSCCKRPGLVLELLLVSLMACSESSPAEPEPASCCANCAHLDYCERCPGLREWCYGYPTEPEGEACVGLEGDDLCSCLLVYGDGGQTCRVENGVVVLVLTAEYCLTSLGALASSRNACDDGPLIRAVVSEHRESDLP